jgi:hypothetical protein
MIFFVKWLTISLRGLTSETRCVKLKATEVKEKTQSLASVGNPCGLLFHSHQTRKGEGDKIMNSITSVKDEITGIKAVDIHLEIHKDKDCSIKLKANGDESIKISSPKPKRASPVTQKDLVTADALEKLSKRIDRVDEKLDLEIINRIIADKNLELKLVQYQTPFFPITSISFQERPTRNVTPHPPEIEFDGNLAIY